MAVVVLVTAYAAFTSSSTSSKLADDNRQRLELQQVEKAIQQARDKCTSDTLFQVATALDKRSNLSLRASKANVKLQQEQLRLLSVVLNPASEPGDSDMATSKYIQALTDFVTSVGTQTNIADEFPYPTPENYARCLEAAQDAKPRKD